jgi:hypothetical protein
MLRLPNVFAPAGRFSIDERNHIFLTLMDNIIHLLFVQYVWEMMITWKLLGQLLQKRKGCKQTINITAK